MLVNNDDEHEALHDEVSFLVSSRTRSRFYSRHVQHHTDDERSRHHLTDVRDPSAQHHLITTMCISNRKQDHLHSNT